MVNLLPQVACMAIALIGETHGTNNIELTHGVGYVIMNRAEYNVNRICDVTEAPYQFDGVKKVDRKSTRLNSSHVSESRMPSSA